ncbi:unnamed protein product [Rangifer tarandus platyrhynchus]|uniref:Uncharacterized protein n=1 Tax=Rangifer tarandus platyrhynchus TaxID=3082113 RepID=A0ABN8YIG0_RANTA|nr:unnamed protein product [Rangifer tarandus platyrhynchus]
MRLGVGPRREGGCSSPSPERPGCCADGVGVSSGGPAACEPARPPSASSAPQASGRGPGCPEGASSGGFLRLSRRLLPRGIGPQTRRGAGGGLRRHRALWERRAARGATPGPAGASEKTRSRGLRPPLRESGAPETTAANRKRLDTGAIGVVHPLGPSSRFPQYSSSVQQFLERFLKKNTILLSSWLGCATQALTGSSQGIRWVSI